MKLQIKEFAALVGVSVRTLHYYDEIGLLAPACVDAQSGYRYYDDASLARMQEILFYRELDFPLKEIAALLASPNYDKAQALAAQKELLILKRDRLDRLITAIDSAEKGVIDMNAFDNSAFEAKRDAYAAEAKERWGASDAWQEHEMKTKNYSSEKWQTLSARKTPAGSHQRKLLHLHERDPRRPWPDVHRRRALPRQHRPPRRWHRCLRQQSNYPLLPLMPFP